MNPDKPIIHDLAEHGMKFHIVETPENPQLGMSLTTVNGEPLSDMDLESLSALHDIVDRSVLTTNTQLKINVLTLCQSQIHQILEVQHSLVDAQRLLNQAVQYRLTRLAQRQREPALKNWLLKLAETECQQPESTGRAFQPYTPTWISAPIVSGYGYSDGATVAMIPSVHFDIHGDYIRPKHDLTLYPLGSKDGLNFFLQTRGVVELRTKLDENLVRQLSDLGLPNFPALI
ncbi:MAG: hypothetical protein PHN51_11735 [Candidatus Nanopelagicales bacterium]|nr:hypothetical protein [Candidatus Nanopelagicales bacterium]